MTWGKGRSKGACYNYYFIKKEKQLKSLMVCILESSVMVLISSASEKSYQISFSERKMELSEIPKIHLTKSYSVAGEGSRLGFELLGCQSKLIQGQAKLLFNGSDSIFCFGGHIYLCCISFFLFCFFYTAL